VKGSQHNFPRTHEREAQQSRQMTITTQRTTANSPAQAAKNRVRGPTVAARRRGSGRSPVRSFASYGGGHSTARWPPPQ